MNNTLIINREFSIIQPFILKWKINLKIFWVLSFILIISLLIFYIFQVNNLAENIYQIKIYQKKIDELSQEGEILKINSAKINSLADFEVLIKNFGFEKAEKVRYIEVLETQIATK